MTQKNLDPILSTEETLQKLETSLLIIQGKMPDNKGESDLYIRNNADDGWEPVGPVNAFVPVDIQGCSLGNVPISINAADVTGLIPVALGAVELAGTFSGGVTVSTSPVLIVDIAKLGWVDVTNNGSGFLYVSFDSSVAVSGAHMGHKVYPGGCFSPSAFYSKLPSAPIRIYGIYSETASSQNVAFSGAGELTT